jgi:hypothetical protein
MKTKFHEKMSMKIGLTLNLTVVLEEKEIIHTVSLVPAYGLTFLLHYTCQSVVRLELEGAGPSVTPSIKNCPVLFPIHSKY